MALINNFLDCRTIYLIGDILHQIVTVGGRGTVELQTKCREDLRFTLMVRGASSRAFPRVKTCLAYSVFIVKAVFGAFN